MNETMKLIFDREMVPWKVYSYKPRTNRINSKFNHKTSYICSQHCNIATKIFRSGVICRNDNYGC